MDHRGWDERYAATDLVWSAEPNAFLPPVVSSLPKGTALDIACGEGRNAIWLAKQGWEVTAVDFSPVGIEKGKQLGRDLNITWVVADATTHTPDTTFDLVIVFYLHLPQDQFTSTIEHAVAAVAPSGTLLCVGHALRNLADGTGGPQVAEILWTQAAFELALEGMDIIELDERLRPVADADRDAIDLIAHATKPALRHPDHSSDASAT